MGTFSRSEAVVCLGLLDGSLPEDRPGIVTDFVTSTCPARVENTPSQVPRQLSDGPLEAVLAKDADSDSQRA
jgi:hypothetical protein